MFVAGNVTGLFPTFPQAHYAPAQPRGKCFSELPVSWALNWGDHARVLAPDELRHQIKTAAQKRVCYYEKGGD